MKNRFLTLLSLLVFFMPLTSFDGNKPKKKKVKAPASAVVKNPTVETAKNNPYYIIVDKSDYELRVYDAEGWYATYPVVFGSNDLGDKRMEGDKRTPEGKFKVLLKKIHPKWGPELLLDYPTQESIQKFNDRLQKGVIPRTAKIGNGIAIHGTRSEEEWTVDYFQNWTDGCVSLKYTEAKDLYSYIPAGTPVTIQK